MDRIKAADALWVRPPRSFIDLWNAACGKWGRYNKATGYFELNGLTDITYEEALMIYNGPVVMSQNSAYLFRAFQGRTNLPPKTGGGTMDLNTTAWEFFSADGLLVHSSSPMEVLNLAAEFAPFTLRPGNRPIIELHSNGKLRRIIGPLAINRVSGSLGISAPRLADIELSGLVNDCDIRGIPSINAISLRYLLEHKYATHPTSPTVTIHANPYAKMTGDTSNAAAAALSPEELTEWASLLDLAAEKNVTFAPA